MDFLTFRSNALQNLTLVKDSPKMNKTEIEEWIKSEYKRHYPATKKDAIEAIKILREFLPAAELRAITDGCRSEEMQFFFDKVVEMANIIKTMPVTYEQDGKGDQAIAYLHYFKGSGDWYITEKDAGTPEEPGQHQSFGLADLGYGGELGYISIVELTGAGVEMDLHFTPKTLAEIKQEAN